MPHKSANLLQAQVAAYTAEHVVNQQDRNYVFANIGLIAAGELYDVARAIKLPKPFENAGSDVQPSGVSIKLVATAASYQRFVQHVQGSQYEPINQRAAMLNAYPTFKPLVDKIDNSSSQSDSLFDKGHNAAIHSIRFQGKTFAVRFPYEKSSQSLGPRIKAEYIDNYMGGLILAKGLAHFEQWAAASYEDGLTISELLPGKKLDILTSEDTADIENDQLKEFGQTLMTAHNIGIVIDANPSNFLFDPLSGFNLVDFKNKHAVSQRWSNRYLAQFIGIGASVVGSIGLTPEYYLTNESDYAQNLARCKENLVIQDRYRTQIGQLTLNQDTDDIFKFVDYQRQKTQIKITEYSSLSWVRNRMAELARFKASQKPLKIDTI